HAAAGHAAGEAADHGHVREQVSGALFLMHATGAFGRPFFCLSRIFGERWAAMAEFGQEESFGGALALSVECQFH
ncbi:hypothetical protein KGP93_37835, partial [Burkholderia multivorans]|nr:hypothetical protein [Burkholderia multivorans]